MRKLVVLVVVIFLAACTAVAPAPTPTPTPAPTCFEMTVDYRAAVDDIVERWDDAAALANSSPRGSLSGPLGDLQEIKRNTGDIVPPNCAAQSHELLVNYMQLTIDAFIAFMGNKSDTTVNVAFTESGKALDAWGESYAALGTE